LARDHEVETTDGGTLRLSPSTLCVHGDTPGAASLAGAVRDALELAGLTVDSFSSK
jgi:UPF0271 protein